MPDFIPHADLIRNEVAFEKRRETRIYRYMLVSYRQVGQKDRAHLTVSMDVSKEGMSIWTKAPIRKDTVLSLSICKPGSLQVFRARARVCWSRAEAGVTGVRTGLTVVSSSPPGKA